MPRFGSRTVRKSLGQFQGHVEGSNHLLLESEQAFHVFLREARRFLGTDTPGNRTEISTGLALGNALAQYRIDSRLGAGGMGVVYKAWDTRLCRDVAVKVLSNTAGTSEDGRRRLLREARHAAALNHPNICTIHEVAEAGGVNFIVMELVTGRPLNVLTAAGAFPETEVESLGAQIADALAHAHERRVIHGDLKSANVMVRDDGCPKVLDFGIARRMRSEAHDTLSSTMPGDIVAGTPAYMAPEVLSGGPPDVRSDIWALGVLLYEMATGRLPFSGRGLDLCAAVLRDEPRLPRRTVSVRLSDTIHMCLEKRPERRLASAADVAKRLRRSDSGIGFPTFGGMFDR
jgi:serine/threonine-protein kinase